MRINVSLEHKLPGKAVEHQLSESIASLEYLGREMHFAAPVELQMSCTYDGGAIIAKGKLTTMFSLECALCLKRFTQPFSLDFEERFSRNSDEDEEDDSFPYVGDDIELERMVMSLLLLNMDSYAVCSADCKGLCPVCGCNRNTAQCACAQETEDATKHPLSALAALLNDNKEV